MIQYVVDKNRPYAQVIEEKHLRGGLSATTSYVYGDALISGTTEGSTHYYHTDGLSSVRGLSDASGALTDRYTYDAYGLLTSSSGATVNPYLYRGEQFDADLNAYYLRARYYQPGIGRFLTTDPVEGFSIEPLSQHRYIYGVNDPVNRLDPSGEMSMLEMTGTAIILNGLSTIALQHNVFGVRSVYETLGEKVFPDAAIFGGMGSVTGLTTWFQRTVFPNVGGGFIPSGIEILYSISSGEVGIFYVGGFATEFGRQLSALRNETIWNWSLYHGAVFNLWNAENYKGPFANIDGNWGKGGLSMFGAPNQLLSGPWGILRTIWASNDMASSFRRSLGFGWTYYKLIEKKTYPSEYHIFAQIMMATFLEIVTDQSVPIKHNGPAILARWLLESSYWYQVTQAKYYWNKNTGDSVKVRQQVTREHYDAQHEPDFQSGPALIFSAFGF